MVGYLPIADEEVQPGAPLLSSLGVRLRDNPRAIAEGWQDAPNVLRKRVRLFTSSGTWTKPAQIRCVEVWVVGGGGGGGASGPNSEATGAAGGGGGAAHKAIDRDALASSISVTVGSAGSGGSSGGTSDPGGDGQNGGASSFGSHASATGGQGGTGGTGLNESGTPGSGGTGSNGDVNLRGQSGSLDTGGGQGAGPYGGVHVSSTGAPTSSQNYGVGGGNRRGSSRADGRNGTGGVVVIIEYLGGEEDA